MRQQMYGAVFIREDVQTKKCAYLLVITNIQSCAQWETYCRNSRPQFEASPWWNDDCFVMDKTGNVLQDQQTSMWHVSVVKWLLCHGQDRKRTTGLADLNVKRLRGEMTALSWTRQEMYYRTSRPQCETSPWWNDDCFVMEKTENWRKDN